MRARSFDVARYEALKEQVGGGARYGVAARDAIVLRQQHVTHVH
jgi:hypothetical protein